MACKSFGYGDLDDHEWPDPDEEDNSDETMPCPHCHKPVYEDAEQCPTCGKYLSREDAPWNKPLWLVLGVIVCLLIIAMWTL
jgi:endogenous inhibitor of DNA gyrase (YacG/DUF329 family)